MLHLHLHLHVFWLWPIVGKGIAAPVTALEAFEIASTWWPTMVLQLIELVTRRGRPA